MFRSSTFSLVLVFLSILLAKHGHCQLVCQVIEEIPCDIQDDLCEWSSVCFDIGDGMQCFLEKEQTTFTENKYYGVRPAEPSEAGFFFAVHSGTVRCYGQRPCNHDCSAAWSPIWGWLYYCTAEQVPWTPHGMVYVVLIGSDPCYGLD